MNDRDRTSAETGESAVVRSAFLESLLGYCLRRANNTFMADFAASVGDLDLRPALFALLAVVRDNPGINQTALGRSLGIQRANLVPLVNELTTRDLVRRQPHPRDRRAFALSLTRPGEELLADAERRIRAHEERMLAGLTERERETLRELLNRIRGD
jgi:DNA-binding MarR family transcriptional regulator